MRFLIAEDDFASRKALESLLTAYGECHGVIDGAQAVEAFEKAIDEGQPYDLVCLDILMPEMDGHEALRRIRMLEKGQNRSPGWLASVRELFRQNNKPADWITPIIIVSGLDDQQNIAQAYLDGGVSAYVPKPVDNKAFIKLLGVLGVLEDE